MSTTTPPCGIPASRVTAWDRAAIIGLAAAGFALSYDALRQTAEAIHVRGALTYLFPLVIDGFIAYGVRALLILRGAAFTARAYVWTLFLASTAASVWANTLHAVRLNDQTPIRSGLHLGDTAVGALSMIAPLALAGAVHLGILIARHTAVPAPDAGANDWTDAVNDHAASGPTLPTGTTQTGPDSDDTDDGTRAQSLEPQADREAAARRKRTGRPPGASMDQLLAVARPAVAEHGVTVAAVQQAIREASLPIGSARFTQLMNLLRAELAESADLRDEEAREHPAHE
ncbi:DUF2637 domain-containing protein [Streptomyces sp. RPT161]|uniref:DUF2637 domain-containing protein n=1 Tax=Streptomyces sp. RPT161 TaxID=3015993 RepID=UPI0022B882F2|nr:DUF2637 domain-containing protein [Streptomyces sp. RPT161]